MYPVPPTPWRWPTQSFVTPPVVTKAMPLQLSTDPSDGKAGRARNAESPAIDILKIPSLSLT
jgi:hypothetical protein